MALDFEGLITAIDHQKIFAGRIPVPVAELLFEIRKSAFANGRKASVNDGACVCTMDGDDRDRAAALGSKLSVGGHKWRKLPACVVDHRPFLGGDPFAGCLKWVQAAVLLLRSVFLGLSADNFTTPNMN